MLIKLFAASLIILLAHASASAAPPQLITPSGPWHVEYAGSMCLLSRPYGTKPEIRLILKPSMIGDKLEIIVTTAKTRLSDRQSGKTALAIAGKPVADEQYFNAYSTVKERVVRIGSADETLTLAALRDTLSIDAGREVRHLFALPGIERARPAVNACLDQLRTMYKVTKADLAPIVTEPDAKLYSFFRSSDYPLEALNKNQSGTIGVLVWVEPDGLISTCEVIEPVASLILNQTTCNILKRRARFAPAKDAAGKAIRAPSTARINWQLAH